MQMPQPTQTQRAIEGVYAALDHLMDVAPGWSRFILRASEPMYQVFDSIESTLESTQEDYERTNTNTRAGNVSKAQEGTSETIYGVLISSPYSSKLITGGTYES